ncbi:MAG: HEAT repeat domain-containing protein, partial [Chloroflexi bacterium]|nr:HEAT repeat domain-containing protein [Chloroflexota bacterium]
DELRRRALEAVSHRSLPAVAAAIERAYASPDLKMRASAICAMGRNCDRRWLDIIGSELASGGPELRYEAARASGELGEPVLVRPLARLLVDRDPEVRVAAVGALGEIGGRQARQALKYCLESDDLVIRDAAAEALKNLDFLEDPLDVDREVGG